MFTTHQYADLEDYFWAIPEAWKSDAHRLCHQDEQRELGATESNADVAEM